MIGIWVIYAQGIVLTQESHTKFPQDSIPPLHFSQLPVTNIVVNPFPKIRKTLVQPIDSIEYPIGLLSFPYQKKEITTEVSWDW